MDDRIRTSDADRERVTAKLRDHYAEGRLTRDELDERVTAALKAKTFGDLRRLLADLPEPSLVTPQRGPLLTARGPFPVFRRRPRLFPLLALALLALILVPGAGAAAIAIKVALSIVALMFVFMALAAIAAASFIRRASRQWHASSFDRYTGQRQTWTWPYGYRHQARRWRMKG